jgi:hypothetical protein
MSASCTNIGQVFRTRPWDYANHHKIVNDSVGTLGIYGIVAGRFLYACIHSIWATTQSCVLTLPLFLTSMGSLTRPESSQAKPCLHMLAMHFASCRIVFVHQNCISKLCRLPITCRGSARSAVLSGIYTGRKCREHHFSTVGERGPRILPSTRGNFVGLHAIGHQHHMDKRG